MVMTLPTHPTVASQDVPMSEFVVDDALDVLTTDSLGPCIAIGVRHGEWLALLHQFGPSQGLTLPLFRVALNPRFTRPFYAVPRTSAARIASG